MDDLISRQAAIDAVKKNTFRLTFAEEQNCEGHVAWSANAVYSDVIEGALLELPSAQPEIKPINYRDCSNAMLKMWMYNVVTDGEYYRIMDKLYKHETERLRRGEQDG